MKGNRDRDAAGRRDRARSRRSVGLAVLGAAAAIAMAGCGGSKPPSVASVTTTPSSSAAGTSTGTGSGAAGSGPPASQAQLQQDELKYAECMRANGVPAFPDPSAGGGFSVNGVDRSSSAFQAAQAKCQKLLPGGGLAGPGSTTHPSAQWLAHMVAVARCMRRHGIADFPDPRTSVPSNPFPNGGAGVISNIEGVILVFPSTIDTQSPLFVRAATTCGFPLHNH